MTCLAVDRIRRMKYLLLICQDASDAGADEVDRDALLAEYGRFNAEYGAEGANDRILVNKLAEQVRVRIQEMIDGLLKTRKSILFG